MTQQPSRSFGGIVPAVGLMLALAAPATGGWWPCDGRKEAVTAERVDRAFETGRVMPLSSYDDDPFVQDSAVECLDPIEAERTADGRPILANTRVAIVDEDRIYLEDPTTGDYVGFAWNPWPIPLADEDGSFRFPDEERFPLHRVQRDANGMIVLRDGLQEWLPQDLHRGMNAVFEAANAARAAAEDWSGRELPWGQNGRLEINAHAFIDFNAFYSPSARMLFFGVVPYRLGTTVVQMFEMGSSWESAAHESGHAILHVLKPNAVLTGLGFRTWGESFGDQIAMWTALRDPGRGRALLAATDGNLAQSNALSIIGEALAALAGEGDGIRNAFNDETVSTTSTEVHDRSRVLTGAAYRVFLAVYDENARKGPDERALRHAGAVMGTFLTRATDHAPENAFTIEDVGKAYLKVDAEFFAGRYHALLVDEFTRREVFDAESVGEWLAHEAALPALRLHGWLAPARVDEVVQANVDQLGIGPDFGLALHSITRDERAQRTIVRVQLTLGRGPGALPLDNHGILVFRTNGTLADYHPPLAPEALSGGEAVAAIDGARRLGLEAHGAPLALTHDATGRLMAEARVLRGDGMGVWLDVFTADAPEGERREVVARSYVDEGRTGMLLLGADELAK